MLYLKVKQKLEDMINEGIYSKGDRLPSEPVLAKQFNVSRSTLREAIKILQRQGILTSRNGAGTYVNRNNAIVSDSLNVLQSTEKLIGNSGFSVMQSQMRTYKEKMKNEWKEKLNCDGNAVIIERIRNNEDRDFAYTFNIIPEHIAGNFFENGVTGSLLLFLKENLDINISYSVSEICIPDGKEVFDEKAVKKLGKKTILLKQLHFNDKDEPVFYSYDYMNNNHVKLFVRRDRE